MIVISLPALRRKLAPILKIVLLVLLSGVGFALLRKVIEAGAAH